MLPLPRKSLSEGRKRGGGSIGGRSEAAGGTVERSPKESKGQAVLSRIPAMERVTSKAHLIE